MDHLLHACPCARYWEKTGDEKTVDLHVLIELGV